MLRLFILLPLLLAGCSQPVSGQELLSEYLEISDSGHVDRFHEVLSGSALTSAKQAQQIMDQLELHQSGRTSFYAFEPNGPSQYLFCLDVSQTKLHDEAGNDLTPEDRPLQVPMQMNVVDIGGNLFIDELDIRRYDRC